MILSAGVNVVVSAPGVPNFTIAPPVSSVVVLPIAGPRGANGASGSAYSFTQLAPAATWTIVHNLGRYPVFNLFLDSDPTSPVYTDTTYPDDNTTVVEWPSAVSGRAEA